jgi:hypothetical protein
MTRTLCIYSQTYSLGILGVRIRSKHVGVVKGRSGLAWACDIERQEEDMENEKIVEGEEVWCVKKKVRSHKCRNYATNTVPSFLLFRLLHRRN